MMMKDDQNVPMHDEGDSGLGNEYTVNVFITVIINYLIW